MNFDGFLELPPGTAEAGARDTADRFFETLETAQKSGWARIQKQQLEGWTATVDAATKLQIDPRKFYAGIDAIDALRQKVKEANQDNLGAAFLGNQKELEGFRRLLDEKRISEQDYAKARGLLSELMSAKIAEEHKAEVQRAREAGDAINELRMKAAEASGRDTEALDLQVAKEVETFRRMLEEKRISETEFAEARALIHEAASTRVKEIIDRETQAVRELQETIAGPFKSAFDSAFDSIVSGSFDAKQAVASLIQELAKAITKKLILDPLANSISGGISNMMGGVAPRAHGGPMNTGRPYIAGERGPELIVPQAASYAVPRWKEGSGGGSSGGSNVYNIDARGSDAGVTQRIMEAMAKTDRDRANGVLAQQRFAKRFPARR